MPAQSKKQQMAAGAALAAKKGEQKVSNLRGASRQMYESMSKRQLEEIAGTKRKRLPRKKQSTASGQRSSSKRRASGRSQARSRS